MSIDIKQIKADREAGTDGPWHVPDQTWSRHLTVEVSGDGLIPCPGSHGAMSYTNDICSMGWGAETPIWSANARRIARVPDLEAQVIADADRIAELVAENKALLKFAEIAINRDCEMVTDAAWKLSVNEMRAALRAAALSELAEMDADEIINGSE